MMEDGAELRARSSILSSQSSILCARWVRFSLSIPAMTFHENRDTRPTRGASSAAKRGTGTRPSFLFLPSALV
jgi:hypothetical protein